jgi:hypothetical protein
MRFRVYLGYIDYLEIAVVVRHIKVLKGIYTLFSKFPVFAFLEVDK